MAFDCHEKKRLLYADLFKTQKSSSVGETTEQQNTTDHSITSRSELGSSSSFSSNQSTSFCDSSSSGFSTPFDYELESEDGDFMAELTRQMAEGMLLEEEEEEIEENSSANSVFEEYDGISKNYSNQRYTDSAAIDDLKNGLYPNPIPADDRTPTLQIYQLKNQPPVSRGKRVKGTESTRQKQFRKREQRYVQYRGRDWGIGHGLQGQNGSGMQAVFLGGSGSRNGSTGTGVFLPRVNNNPTEHKKKSGCSTVLIPTRVLQALEIHFNSRPDSLAPPLIGGFGSPNLNHSFPKDESIRSNEQQNGVEEMELPQEWTY